MGGRGTKSGGSSSQVAGNLRLRDKDYADELKELLSGSLREGAFQPYYLEQAHASLKSLLGGEEGGGWGVPPKPLKPDLPLLAPSRTDPFTNLKQRLNQGEQLTPETKAEGKDASRLEQHWRGLLGEYEELERAEQKVVGAGASTVVPAPKEETNPDMLYGVGKVETTTPAPLPDEADQEKAVQPEQIVTPAETPNSPETVNPAGDNQQAPAEKPEIAAGAEKPARQSRFSRAERKPIVWLRTTRNNPCPCCGKGGWCEVSEDGAKAHCMHSNYGGTPIEYRGGGRIIELRKDERVDVSGLARRNANVEKLPPDRLDEVNREFMRLCPLKAEHEAYLKAEGIPTKGVGSLELSVAIRIARELVTKFGEETASRHPVLKQFTSRDGERQFWGIAAGTNGILFPAKNVDGQITGIQVRADHPTDKSGRYRWLSSDGKGGTPLSVFNAKEGAASNNHAGTLVITEGYKKAAAINQHWGVPAISVAGVGAYSRDELIKTVEALNVKRVVLAFDQDKRANPMVQEAEIRLLKSLHNTLPNLELNKLEWDEAQGKGLDDAIKVKTELRVEKVNLDQIAPAQVADSTNEAKQAEQWKALRQAQIEADRARKVRHK